jgi:copper transport protein
MTCLAAGRRLAVLRVLIIACAVVMCCQVGRAEAHAVLEQSTPPDRSILATSPSGITLQFDEPVGVTDLRLLDSAGKAIPLTVQAKDNVVQSGLVAALPAGTYTITYRVISADGHPVAGAVQFQIGNGIAHWQAADQGLAWWQWGKIVAHFLLYLGGFTFWALCYRAIRRGAIMSRSGVVASFVIILAACLLIVFQGAGMTGRTAAQFLTGDLWRLGGGTAEGRIAGMFMIAMAIGWLAQLQRARRNAATCLAFISAAILILALSTAGHVAALGWWQIVVLTLHVLVALLWTGSLVPLLRRLAPRSPMATPDSATIAPAPRRARWVVMAIGVASGIGLACWQIVVPGMLLTTAYGLMLSGKIVAVICLILIVVANRWLAARQPATSRSRDIRRFWIAAQISLLVVALGLTAGLGELTPPRHLLAAERDATRDKAVRSTPLLDKMLHAGDVMAVVQLVPLGIGPAGSDQYRLVVSLSSMSGGKLMPQQVVATLSNVDVHLGPLSREMTYNAATGIYTSGPLDLVPPGHWHMEIKADLDDFDRRAFAVDVDIAH